MKPPQKPAPAAEDAATEPARQVAATHPDAIKTLLELVDLSAARAYQRWIPLVSRFTYHLPSVVTPTPESV